MLVAVSGLAAVLTAAAAIWVAAQLGIASADWLAWRAFALPPCRRAAALIAAALVFTAVSIPSPVRITGSPIRTVFAGGSADIALTAGSLVLMALPLAVSGLAAARMTAVMVAAWLPRAAAPLLGWYVFQAAFLHLDVWYYVSWLGWLAVALLALATGVHLAGRNTGPASVD